MQRDREFRIQKEIFSDEQTVSTMAVVTSGSPVERTKGEEKSIRPIETVTYQKLFPFPATLKSIIALILLSTETRIHSSVHSRV